LRSPTRGSLRQPLPGNPDLQADIAERNIGGLGVFFVRQLVPAIRYRWEDGRNILTLPIDPAVLL